MNKKLLSLVLAVAPLAAIAQTQTFTASVTPIANISITENTPLNFGEIPFANGSSCTIDVASTLAGDCIGTNITPSTGIIDVAGLPPSSNVDVTVAGTTENNLTLATAGDVIGDVVAGANTYTNNAVLTVSTDGTAAPAVQVRVGGALTANASLTVGSPLTVSYSVTVALQ